MKAKSDKPNILIFVMDVQRADNMSCYGYPKKTTPNIDKIAEEGTVFLNNVSPAEFTLPSHACVFTGKYVSGHGVGARYQFRPKESFTLTEVLKSAGYRTIGFCGKEHKWALYGIDDQRGFDEFKYVERPAQTSEEKDKGSLRTSQLFAEWVEEHEGETPFFMFVNCTEPHLPYWPPQPFRKRFLLDGVSDERAYQVHNPNIWAYHVGRIKYTKEDWAILRSLYDGETATLDNRMGLMFNELRKRDLLDSTLLIITSDHGDVQGEKDPYIDHVANIYEPTIHVPLICRYPPVFPAGLRVEHLVQTLNIFPTIMEMLGISNKDIWKHLQGYSLLSAITDEPKRTFAVAEYQSWGILFAYFLRKKVDPDFDWRDPYLWRYQKAYRVGHYKYIWASDGKDELYDLSEDPTEQRNLVAEMPEKASEMKRALEDFLFSIEKRDLGDMAAAHFYDEEIIRKLKDYGYYRQIFTPELGIEPGIF